MATRRPQTHLLQSKDRPSSAIYIGSTELYISPSSLPDLPEPPSPVASVKSHSSGLPSPPATNSTGSGSAQGDRDNSGSPTDGHLLKRSRLPSVNMLSDANIKTFNNALASSSNTAGDVGKGLDVVDDDFSDDGRFDGENEDRTARLDQTLSSKASNEDALGPNRVLSLTHRNRMMLDKISRNSSPSHSPGPSRYRSLAPAAPSSSSSSSNTASSRLSSAKPPLASARLRPNDRSSLPGDTVYAYDRDVHTSGSETERESTRHSQPFPSITLPHSYSSSSLDQYPSPDLHQSLDSSSLSNPNASTSSTLSPQLGLSSTISPVGLSQRPRTPTHRSRTPPSQRLRRTSAPASPAKALSLTSASRNSSRTRTPRKQTSMASILHDSNDTYELQSEYHEAPGRSSVLGDRIGSRANSRAGLLGERENNISRASQRAEDVTRAALAAVAQSRRSPAAHRPSPDSSTVGSSNGPIGVTRKPLPREFRDHAGSSESGPRDFYDPERTSSRLSGRLPMDSQTPEGPSPRLPYVNGDGVRTSPRRSTTRASTVREMTRRHQTRFLSEDMSSVYSRSDDDSRQQLVASGPPPESRLGIGALGRRQSLRGGSAESALAAPGRLAGEGLRAAGLTRRGGDTVSRRGERNLTAFRSERRSSMDPRDAAFDRQEAGRQEEVERRSQSRTSESTGKYSDEAALSARTRSSGTSDLRTPNPPNRRDSNYQTTRRVEPTPRASTSMALFRTPDSVRSSHTVRRSGADVGESVVDYVRGRGAEEGDPPMTAPPALRTYRSNLGMDARAGSSMAQSPRYSSPFGPSRRNTFAVGTRSVGAASREQQVEHTRLMRDSLAVFASNVDRLRGERQLWDLVRGAEGVVGTTERLNEIMRNAANDAMQNQIDADVNNDETAGNIWRAVGAEWRDTLRSSDELVRGLTSLLLGVGKAVRDLGSSVDDRVEPDREVDRPLSQHEDDVQRVSTSPEVMSNGGSDRRSVGSRRSWEPSTQRERDREETLRKLSAGTARNGTYLPPPRADPRITRESQKTSAPLNGPATSSSARRRISDMGDLGLDRDYPLVASLSQETALHYESPTPVSRLQSHSESFAGRVGSRTFADRDRTHSVPPLAVPPPLPTLPSETLLQRNQAAASSKPSARERRSKPSIASASTVRPIGFPAISTGNPTTAVTPHTVSMSPEERHQAFSFPAMRNDSDRTGGSANLGNAAGRSTVTFSRPTDISVSTTLTGLRDRDVRQRTISSTSSIVDEPSTSAPRTRVAEMVNAYSPVTPLSGSETERDIRRRTVGTRAAMDADRGLRAGGSSQVRPTLPGGRRNRRPTVTEIFSKD